MTVHWNTPIPDVLPTNSYYRYDFFSLPNISFVIPAHHPAVATYYCIVWGTHTYNNDVLLAREATTIKVKGTHNHACLATTNKIRGIYTCSVTRMYKS